MKFQRFALPIFAVLSAVQFAFPSEAGAENFADSESAKSEAQTEVQAGTAATSGVETTKNLGDAESENPTSAATEKDETRTAKDDDFQRFSGLPFVSYSEETKIEYGGVLIVFFRPCEGGSEVSSVDILLMGTQRSQFEMRISPYLFLLREHLKIDAELEIAKWPGDYFERGSSGSSDPIASFDKTSISGEAAFEFNYGVPSALRFRYGPVVKAEYRENDFDDIDEGGSRRDGAFGGGGYVVQYNSLDNENWPSRGAYAAFEQVFFGGEFAFHTEELDLKTYITPFYTTTFAFGLLWQQSRGDVPYGYLAGPDGMRRFRGVDSGVWNDKQATILQFEIRQPLFWRFAATAFVEGLKSGPYFSKMLDNDLRYAVGFGGRLALNKSEKLYGRADLSIVNMKDIGFTLDLREAF